mgnify:CR=1 FL=1
MTNKKEITISQGKRTKMVVIQTQVKGKKNRKGEPFVVSETKHRKV